MCFLLKPDIILDDRLDESLTQCEFIHPNNAHRLNRWSYMLCSGMIRLSFATGSFVQMIFDYAKRFNDGLDIAAVRRL